MALVKIKDVYLYIGLTENGAECFNAKKILADNNIPHKVLSYNDIAQHEGVFNALSTWRWGPDNEQQTFDDFPIIHWTECYDDFSTKLFCVTSVTQLNLSKVVTQKELVE